MHADVYKWRGKCSCVIHGKRNNLSSVTHNIVALSSSHIKTLVTIRYAIRHPCLMSFSVVLRKFKNT